ncbi:MAG TPA: non-canonical purine NTP pyrophosphatase [Candidatus Binataceae bacterium]
MRRLLIATSNPAKLAEYRLLLREIDFELISLADAKISEAPEETGATFAENALLKARFYFARAGIPTLADDGGLEIDALGGEPGVQSHRWLSAGGRKGVQNNSDRALVDEVIRRMQGVAEGNRTARIRATVALIWPERGATRERFAEAAIEGVIAAHAFPKIRPGFPYRAVLFLPERGCYLGELGDDEEARIGQRRGALDQLLEVLKQVAEGR